MPERDAPELHVLAAAVHGALAALHALALLYNMRRGNRGDVLVHSLALAYDTQAVVHHARVARAGGA